MHYITVFDASVHPYRNLTFVLPGIGFMLVGAVMVFRPAWVEALFGKPFRHRYIFRWFFFLFSFFWTASVTIALIKDARNANLAMERNDCKIVEGAVEHFHPMPATGHDTERFDVHGVKFAYSDFIVTAGFNNTASHGGPIREGLPVRICYRDDEILRLQVAG